MTAVSFDLDGTLVRSSEPRERSLDYARRTVDASLPRISVDTYQTAFRTALRERLPDTAREMPVRRDAFARAFDARGHDPSAKTLDAVARAYRRRRVAALRPQEGAADLLASIQATGRDIVVVTNGPAGLQREKLERTGLAEDVDGMGVAGRCGAAKPDPRPFEVAFEGVDSSMNGAIHVGNSRDDVAGARRAGLRPVLLDPDGPDQSDDSIPRCRSLAALSRRVLD